MLRPSSSQRSPRVEVYSTSPITGAMRKLFHTFPPPWSFLIAVVGLIALTVVPTAATAKRDKLGRGVNSARVVTKRVTTSRRYSDPDRDGLTSSTEQRKTRTNPYKFDTDGDGFGDGAEVLAGTNPLNPASTPAGPPAPTPPPADTTAPDTTIGSGPPNTTTSTSASFSFGSTESGSTYQCSLDASAWSSCVSPKAYSPLTVGPHTFAVTATDVAGNTDPSPATRSWTVEAEAPPADTTPPDTTISSGPPGRIRLIPPVHRPDRRRPRHPRPTPRSAPARPGRPPRQPSALASPQRRAARPSSASSTPVPGAAAPQPSPTAALSSAPMPSQ
jgi:hypothetical protein